MTIAGTTSRIGRYEIVAELATGGMAEILLGRMVGPRGFTRPVVIKRILPHLARQRGFVDMFVDEAMIVAGIRHPNVVQVQEFSRDGDALFLVMEYLEGEGTGALLRRLRGNGETLDRGLAAHIVAQACAGLHAAHELVGPDGVSREIVHRYISPQNVIVTYAGDVKVLDFGIAQAADRITRTDVGQRKGKFEYMAPEQCRGEPLDRRCDIFALGILLYGFSTGMHLFRRPTELMTFKAICDEPVVRPSEILPDYPVLLEAVCMRALAQDRALRYSTAAEMRHELTAAARSLAGPDAPDEALGSLMRRLFSDRMGEKAEMLRQFSTGASVPRVPQTECDETIELPTVHGRGGQAEALASGPEVRNRPAARRAPVRLLLVAGVAVVALAGGLAPWRRGAAPRVGAAGNSFLPDVVVTSVSHSNGLFTSTVKNQGAGATPTGVAVGVVYSVDGAPKTWGAVRGPIAAGASVTIGTDGPPHMIPTGTHAIAAYVDDINRFPESDENNNKRAALLRH